MNKKIVVITGATASGKTKTAIALAKAINAEIICADSRIVYKDLDIVSAKPTLKEQEGIKHHLIDIVDANQEFSAGDFVNLSKKIIDEIFALNKNVIIAGGTWFYIKCLLDKKMLPPAPINPALRKELEKLTSKELWELLNQKDSKRALEIHLNNRDKIIRSIEMCDYLKHPISSYIRKDNEAYCAKWYMNDFPREILYERINLRVDEMIKAGLFEEWKRNKEKYPNSNILINTIGYSEFYDMENGVYNQKTAIEKIKQHTRNFAKRQLTYFKSNKDIKFINNSDDIIRDLENEKN